MRISSTNRFGVAITLCMTFAASLHAQDYRAVKGNPAFAEVIENPDLPRVLLIGDSISIGYTVPVREFLKGKANVYRIPGNGGPTTRGLERIDDWLGETEWDVIHFNWGLHDLKFINDKGALVSVDQGQRQVSICDYHDNLETLVNRLKKTNAKLIWRNTTPVPKGANGRIPNDELKYNAVAKRIMEAHDIPIDDQHAFCLERLEDIQRPANVHFTPEGSRQLGQQAANAILEALKD